MSTPTQTAPAADLDLAGLLKDLMGPPQVKTMWSASYAGPGTRIFTDTRSAATFITDETRRRVRSGNREPVTVNRLDGGMEADWNASSDVADVLAATGWAARCAEPSYAVAWRLRDDVINVLEDILVAS
ncbi:MAG TPA: hypothetical protein VF867_14045 [Arthrobacter sp.]